MFLEETINFSYNIESIYVILVSEQLYSSCDIPYVCINIAIHHRVRHNTKNRFVHVCSLQGVW